MTRKNFKRRNYFVNKQVQGIYALFIIMSVGIISLLVSMEILRTFYNSFGATGNTSAFFSNIDFSFILKVSSLMILGSLVIGGLSLFASHRIAGPIFRLNKSLKKFATGHFGERIQFRKQDYFQEVAENFNTMAESIEKRIDNESKIVSEMGHKVDDIVDQMALTGYDRESTMIALQELKDLIEKYQQIIKQERGF